VCVHGQALLTGDDSTVVVLADFTQPVGVILNALVHHVLDEEDPDGAVDRYKQPLASGNYRAATAGAAASWETKSCTRPAPSATSCRMA
jgi:hypothetical protein